MDPHCTGDELALNESAAIRHLRRFIAQPAFESEAAA